MASGTRATRLVLLASVTAAVGGLLFGYDTGVISSSLIFIKREFGLDALEQGMIASALAVGAILGAVGAGPLADRFGRKPAVLAASGVFAIGGVFAALSPDAASLIAARVVIGVSVGAASVLVPLFIAEIAPPAIRGRLVTLNQLMITIGILVSYLIGYLLSEIEGWRWMFAFAVIPAALLAAGMSVLPETPRWLIAHDRMDRARTELARLRTGEDVDRAVEEEIAAIRDTKAQGRVGWRQVTGRSVRPALLVGLGIQFLAQLTGVNAVIYYAPTILTNAGLGASAAILATVGVGVINVVMTVVGMSLIDRSGRRPLLLWGLGFMIPALIVLGFVLATGTLSGFGLVLAIAGLLAYIAAVAVSVDTIVFVIPAEIYPLRVRGKAMGITLVMNWSMNFVISLSFLPVLQSIGPRPTFWIFAALCLVMWLFVRFVVPETKGRSLEEIEHGLRRD
ncbi:sugar porter family MFS transporter [Sciscionella marina]|uniref:sugar porter family MFS transporter n=1 Tax=Sciscionella marina TaxID=508770 RepID=UPI0003AAB4D0|nr:sugar porter family MFS transporter [Sciscionella marina]